MSFKIILIQVKGLQKGSGLQKGGFCSAMIWRESQAVLQISENLNEINHLLSEISM